MRFFYYISAFILLVGNYSCKEKKTLPTSNIELSEETEKAIDAEIQSKDSLELDAETILEKFQHNSGLVASKLGMEFYKKNNLKLADKYFEISADNYLKDSNSVEYAKQISNLGVINEVIGEYYKASDYYVKAVRIFQEKDMELQISKIYNNLGIIHQQLDEDTLALEFYRKSLAITTKLNRNDLNANRYNNIGTIHEEYYLNLDSALYYYEKARKIAVHDSMPNILAIFENNIANIYLMKGHYIMADSLLSEAYETALSSSNKATLSPIYRNQAKLLLFKKEYPKALEKINLAIDLAKENDNQEILLDSYEILKNILEKMKKYEEALEVMQFYYQIIEKVKGEKQHKEFDKLAFQFGVREKENEINILSLENHVQERQIMIQWSILFIIILSGGLIIFFVLLRQKKNHIKMLMMQKDISNYVQQINTLKKNNYSHEEDIKEHIKQFDLTSREQEILFLITKGFTNKEIAAKQFVSINTIKTHVKNIYVKLDVRNRTEATQKAL